MAAVAFQGSEVEHLADIGCTEPARPATGSCWTRISRGKPALREAPSCVVSNIRGSVRRTATPRHPGAGPDRRDESPRSRVVFPVHRNDLRPARCPLAGDPGAESGTPARRAGGPAQGRARAGARPRQCAGGASPRRRGRNMKLLYSRNPNPRLAVAAARQMRAPVTFEFAAPLAPG